MRGLTSETPPGTGPTVVGMGACEAAATESGVVRQAAVTNVAATVAMSKIPNFMVIAPHWRARSEPVVEKPVAEYHSFRASA